jgi:hypothetical protein
VELLEYMSLWTTARYSFVSTTNPAENVRYVSDGKCRFMTKTLRVAQQTAASTLPTRNGRWLQFYRLFVTEKPTDLPRGTSDSVGVQKRVRFRSVRPVVQEAFEQPHGEGAKITYGWLRSRPISNARSQARLSAPEHRQLALELFDLPGR